MWKEFRCPFEKLWEEKGTNIHLSLDENSNNEIEWAIKKFVENKKDDMSSLIIKLPQDIIKNCSSNEDLIEPLFEHQVYIMSKILERALYPFLQYQKIWYKRIWWNLKIQIKKRPELARVANELTKKIGKVSCFDDLYTFLNQDMSSGDYSKNVLNSPVYTLKNLLWDVIIELWLWSLRFNELPLDTSIDFFWIIRTPFYDKRIWRYSENLEMVITRSKDFFDLPEHVRQKIRTDSNTIINKCGINVEDITDGMQPAGLWLENRDTQTIKLMSWEVLTVKTQTTADFLRELMDWQWLKQI